MSTIIPASDLASVVYKQLQTAIKETMPTATVQELQQAELAILCAMGARV